MMPALTWFRSLRCTPTLGLVCAIVVAAVAACSEADTAGTGRVPGRGVYIGAAWKGARTAGGHQTHVVSEKIACAKCHEITGDAIGAVVPGRCASCHEKEAGIEHATAQARERFGADAKADCTVCHAFTGPEQAKDEPHGGTYTARECDRCHMQPQGTTPGVKVHADSDCVRCHRPHDDAKPTSAPCRECHAAVKSAHDAPPSHPGASGDACTTCHQKQHAPAAAARATCAECHAKEKPVVEPATALFADGHTECIGCHRPHEGGEHVGEPVACRACHQDTVTLGAPRVRQHEQCSSCHAPHDVKGSPDRACGKCHESKHPDHPKHGVAGTCVGCHDPHPPSAKASTRARACASCHQNAAHDKGFHGGTECKSCHQPHDFVREATDRTACAKCHQKEMGQAATLAGHQACEGCHAGLPHRPSALAVGCESCHVREQRQVVKGHAQCTSCHEPHGGTMGRACSSCHDAEHKSAPRGHQDCKSCHQAHDGSTAKVACSTCHAPQSKTPHGGMQQGCGSCHRPHGPKGVAQPPACSTCHATPQLAGLHQERKHQDCGRCHTGHGEEKAASARTECLSCHADRKDHFPDAPRCASCHLFEKTR